MLLERVRRALAPDYEILEEIAGGGMGIVFAARQPRLDRKVALKILRPEQATAIAAERFLAEGRVLARLAHPNIVPIYAAGEADGLLYYVMEFVEGETLADRLSRGALPPAEALRLAEDLLGALAAAHALGVVHRDVKPANIFLRNGRALLGDFGIARWREKDEPGYTTPGELIGTPRYMSPEQRDGLPATARTDVYAAGLVLWEACTGARWPFYQDPKSAEWSRLPPALAPAVRRALELEPEHRWEDARQFLAAIERSTRRRARPGALLVAVAILALAIAGYWILRPPPAAPHRGALTLVIPPFRVSGTGVDHDLGDSAAAYIRNLLAGY
ncbi:MAG TPA: serine/threonine-protein kinase, partial [Gemmatimonadales bacterium]|nr:serine/threonine-protein kinase [Gemmatimonadales bacterium]